MVTQELIKPTLEELFEQAVENYNALVFSTLGFLNLHQISILEYAHFVGKQHAESWTPDITPFKLAQGMAFNFMSVGAKLEALGGDEHESHLAITGWPNLELLTAYSGRLEDVDKFTQLVSNIAERQNCTFEMTRQGDRVEVHFKKM
jgi:hypothetical protein